MASLKDLSEQQLRNRARALRHDADTALKASARVRATSELTEIEDELAQRYAMTHPFRANINRLLAKVLGADRRKVERHLRSAGRDEI
jgi:hypothetical protein